MKIGRLSLDDGLGVHVYHHPCHAWCSQVKFLDIESLMNTSATEHKFLDEEVVMIITIACNHFFFFLDNCLMRCYLKGQDDEAKQRNW